HKNGDLIDVGNGFRMSPLVYSYNHPYMPAVSSHEIVASQTSIELWRQLLPLAQRSLQENVERVEPLMNERGEREFVKTRFFASDFLVGLGVIREEVSQRLQSLWWGARLLLLLLICFWGVQREVGRYLSRPLEILLTALQAAAAGNLHWRLELPTRDEFGETAAVFNHMAEKLIEREKMSRFVSDDILQRVAIGEESAIQPGQGEQVETTVLVSDIRSFTTLSEQYPPDQMVEMLNDYFTAMEDGIASEQGTIVSYIGDAIVAHFPLRSGLDDCAQRAVRAAWKMRLALTELNRQRQSTGRFAVRTGIGLATGILVSGVAGSTQGRLTQILLGEPFERATALEVNSKRSRFSGIMVDRDTALRCQKDFEMSPLPDEPETIEIRSQK
ncbi:MAG TPA: adenylate/guanylate cyclase domain-containing protein, partial [Candidatus Ozemobacteraceae bacterium]|nr:adenylate/guanylate cyclase domain-containing protein [Candidatus Ozemobacteraceae bacterium]